MSTHAHHVDPLSLPFVSIPASTSPDAVVKLTLLNCGELISQYVQFRQRDTPEEMKEEEVAVVFTWVVGKTLHGKTEKYLWDAGIVSDLSKFGEPMSAGMKGRFNFDVPPSAQLPEILTHLSPPPATLDDLTALIISHAHPDHYGALDEFPADLPVIVGPGTKAWIDGAPAGMKPIPPHFWEHPKSIEEVGEGAKGHGKAWQSVGAYDKAWDFFGDGSFWLAQAPGHCPGHLVALSRVSTSPDTYVVLGADTCHSRSIYSPYPTPSSRCMCALFPNPMGPEPAMVTMHSDLDEAYHSIARLTRMEMEDNVLSVLAHETEFARELGVGIGQMKQGWEKWKVEGWKKPKEVGLPPKAKMA